MNISITFRHMATSGAIKTYANDKVAKLQKFLRQPMTAKVTLSIDRLKHIAETRISAGGAHLEAKEASEDMYASIDRVIDKLERQIRGAKGAAESKKRRGRDTIKSSAAAAPAPLAEPAIKRVAKKKTAAAKKSGTGGTKAKKKRS
ncbi:MAG: ribosome-associated translation inhibitor RaiA [Myxococcales bacterium]|nr:ribosome-associated translation inhibitor RaiA [Myxococcales bacterium]